MIWRVSTDRGFQTVEARSHKEAALLATGRVLRVRSTKTPEQMAARKRVQEQRERVAKLKAEFQRMMAESEAALKELTPSQLKSKQGIDFLNEWSEKLNSLNHKINIAMGELYRRQEQKKALAGTQLISQYS